MKSANVDTKSFTDMYFSIIRARCPKCNKTCSSIDGRIFKCERCGVLFKREYDSKLKKEVKLIKVPLPMTVRNNNYVATFDDADLWYRDRWRVLFNYTRKVAKLEVDGVVKKEVKLMRELPPQSA